jgi:hypothetical protein
MSNNKQQTAVEQLVSELHRRILMIESETNGIVRTTMIDNFLVDIEEFKEMEKERMIEFAQLYAVIHCMGDITKDAEQFYKETYENEQ